MNKLSIVVIGYNRLDSIKRVLKSLLNAYYPQNADLIISLDYSDNSELKDFCESFQWPFGQKILKLSSVRLGLKNHVLKCGNYLNEYDLDALIVLEDDTYVAPDYFNFAIQAVDRYCEDENIAGISLYSFAWNINADRPFLPLFSGYDVFFMQYPQSWGQVWMRRQWNKFIEWINTNGAESLPKSNIPNNVLQWPSTSWLKLHVMYCIGMDKYFVYPYHSLSTNCADAGTHYMYKTNKMQVPLSMGNKLVYRFPEHYDESVIYDAFFENSQLYTILGIDKEDLAVDLYCKKDLNQIKERYLLTTRKLNRRVIRSYGLDMRPWELNIINSVPGDILILYDLSNIDKKPKIKHLSRLHWVYDTHGEVLLKRNFVDIMFSEIMNKIKRK